MVVCLESWGVGPLSLLLVVGKVFVFPGVRMCECRGSIFEVLNELVINLFAQHFP